MYRPPVTLDDVVIHRDQDFLFSGVHGWIVRYYSKTGPMLFAAAGVTLQDAEQGAEELLKNYNEMAERWNNDNPES